MNFHSKHTLCWWVILISLVSFHLKQKEQKASDMSCGANLQSLGMEDSLQQSPTIDDWEKWQQDNDTKLSQLEILCEIINAMDIDGGSVDLQVLLESLQSYWKQQSPNKRLPIAIRCTDGTYLTGMEVGIYSPNAIIKVMSKYQWNTHWSVTWY